MEEELFEQMHRHAQKHWWFRGRQKIVLSLLNRFYTRPENARVLDLGCGTGVNLPALAQYGEVWGADPSDKALAFCRSSMPKDFTGRLDEIWLPDKVPYDDNSFNLIVMMDVLEHVEHDRESLIRIGRLLRPGGELVLTVPALQWMWTQHDVEHHHFRRYHKAPLRALLTETGYEVQFISYINTLLFPAMAAARLLFKSKQARATDLEGGTRAPAQILGAIFGSERHLLKIMRFPVGGSLAAVVRKK